MINLFISYGGNDREFARTLSETILSEFKDIINTRVIEDHTPFDGKTWKEKVLKDLNQSSIFIIILTENSKYRQWPNQELGYAYALLNFDKLFHLIPVIQVKNWNNEKPIFIPLSGFITDDMDKIVYEIDKPEECINKIIDKLKNIDLNDIEKETNPNLSGFDNNEINILHEIIETIANNDGYDTIVDEKGLKEKFHDLSSDFIRDTLDIFYSKGILNKNHGYYQLNASGFFIYAKLFLNIDTQKDADDILAFISTFPPEKGCHTTEIQKATKLSPVRISFAVEMLELNDYVKVLKAATTYPFNFSHLYSTAKARRTLKSN